MSELQDKLLKKEYRDKHDIATIPVSALLDISEDETKFLKELKF